jgi:uncharacterized membrane protein
MARTDTADLEDALAHVLQLGTYVSVGLIATGSILQLLHGASPLAGGPTFDICALVEDDVVLLPAGFLWLGIVVVVLTPALRVARALLGFARGDEPRMVAVSALVLGVIVVGVVVGVTAH